MKRLYLFLLLAISVSFIFSCKPSPHKEQKLRLCLNSDPTSLDSRKASDLNAHNVIRMLQDGLMRLSPSGKLQYSIAKHHQLAKDGKTYTFYLRDAQWADGSKITAKDFERTWKQILSPTYPSSEAFKFFVIKNAKLAKEGKVSVDSIGVRALNDQTLVIELTSPVPYFLELTAQTAYFPVAKNTPIDALTSSNGPFILENWNHNHKLTLRKNPYYWDYKQVSLEEIEINIIPDETTALNLYETGDIDWLGQPFSALPTDALEIIKDQWEVKQQLVSATCWLVFNTDTFPFNNSNLRKAFSLSVNRKELSADIMHNEHIPAYGPIPNMSDFQATDYLNDSMQEQAKQYLDKALKELNLTKKDLKITFRYNSSEINHRIAQALQDQWLNNLGIHVSLEQTEWKVHLSKLKNKDFQIARTAWFADFSDATAYLDVFKHKTNTSNYPCWENSEFMRILDQSATITDLTKRSQLLKAAEEIFISDMPVAPLYFYSYSFVHSKELKKYTISATGEIDFKWSYFEKGD